MKKITRDDIIDKDALDALKELAQLEVLKSIDRNTQKNNLSFFFWVFIVTALIIRVTPLIKELIFG